MDTNFLRCIEGLSGEDYTTALLGYLLENSKNEALLKYFDLNNDKNKIITTQKTIENGRFDLFMEIGNSCIIIENKFYATFTYVNGIHQLERYSNWLSNQIYENKTLICLSIESRRNEVNLILKNINNNIKHIFLSWEEVVDILKTGDDLQKRLSEFVSDRYLKRISFAPREVNIMLDSDVAKTYNKMFEMIKRIKDLIADENIEILGSIKYEQGAFGFYFSVNNNEYWFGFDSKYWEITGIPFDLQLRNNTNNANERFIFCHKDLFGKHLVFTEDEIIEDTKLASLIKFVC